MSGFLPTLDVGIVVVCEVARHQVFDGEPVELVKWVLKDEVRVFAGPLDFAIFQRKKGGGFGAKGLDVDLLKGAQNGTAGIAGFDFLLDLGKQVDIMHHHACVEEHYAFQFSRLLVYPLELFVHSLHVEHNS